MIKPLGDRVVIEPQEVEKVTKGGIVLPDTAKEKPQEGKVVAVGAGRVTDAGERVPVEVSVGDKVLYAKYGGTEVHFDEKDFIVLNERDILAVVE